MSLALEYTTFEIVTKIIFNWWWIVLPFALWPFFRSAWLWWRQEEWEKREKYILLEIIPPKENLQPFSSMEHILSNIWSIYSSVEGIKNFRKKWIMGRRLYFVTFEIVSVGPHPRFFIRVREEHKDSVRVAFYSQYTEMEFREYK
jgi:hypothetical protein